MSICLFASNSILMRAIVWFRMSSQVWANKVDNLINTINTIDQGVAKVVYNVGDNFENGKQDGLKQIGDCMNDIFNAMDEMVELSKLLNDDSVSSSGHKDVILYNVDQLLEAVDIFAQSLNPENEMSNDVSSYWYFMFHFMSGFCAG